jgi:hypothetical protein
LWKIEKTAPRGATFNLLADIRRLLDYLKFRKNGYGSALAFHLGTPQEKGILRTIRSTEGHSERSESAFRNSLCARYNRLLG